MKNLTIDHFCEALKINPEKLNEELPHFNDALLNDYQKTAFRTLELYHEFLEQMENADKLLDAEISKIDNMYCQTGVQNFFKNEFVQDLRKTQEEIRQRLKFETHHSQFKPYSVTPPITGFRSDAAIMQEILATTLQNLKFESDNQNDIQQLGHLYQYSEKKCQQSPVWKNFFTTAGKLLLTALGFGVSLLSLMAPAPVAIAGFVILGLHVGGMFGIAAFEKSYNETGGLKGLGNDIVQKLTFQTPISSNMKRSAASGLNFFNSLVAKPAPQSSPTEEKPSPALYSRQYC